MIVLQRKSKDVRIKNKEKPSRTIRATKKKIETLKNELKTYQKHGTRFKAIGKIDEFSKSLQKRIRETEELTKNNTKLTQVLALNYGGRAEITTAVNSLIKKGKEILSENDISAELQTPYSDIDLLIRTSGEERISNFLLWQLSYSEFYFSPTLWPDFNANELKSIIENYEDRTRRFGGL